MRLEYDTTGMPNSDTLRESRKDYVVGVLDEAATPQDPFELFKVWFADACAQQPIEPNAFSLATASSTGAPSLRTVLLKGYDERGFVFYTNYQSRKGSQITENPQVALLFFWDVLERQVRIEGRASATSREESVEYFNNRPTSAQLSAMVSHQSNSVTSREEMEAAYSKLQLALGDSPPECPPHWGGYRVVPMRYEFWQGRASRLHDRVLYERDDGGAWSRRRLWP